MSIIFLEVSGTPDIYFEKACFVLGRLGSKHLQARALSLPTLWGAFVGLTVTVFLE